MYDPNGGGTDRIEGSEFEYDQQAGIAKADGPVEITLDRTGNLQLDAGRKMPKGQQKKVAPDPDGRPLRPTRFT